MLNVMPEMYCQGEAKVTKFFFKLSRKDKSNLKKQAVIHLFHETIRCSLAIAAVVRQWQSLDRDVH